MKINIEQNIIIENPGAKNFLADAYFPESDTKLPIVIFAHGYKGYKDWGTWSLMAQEFAKAGFYFVKFNFSHNGTTLENPTKFGDLEAFGNNNYTKELSDFKVVVSYFIQKPNVDENKIIIIGHSRGGGISVIEAFEDERVNLLITFAGVSNFGKRFPHGENFEKWKEDGVMYVENKRTHQKMPHYFQYYEDYKSNEDRLNIQFAAQHLKKLYLIIHGTEDEAVSLKEAQLLDEWCKTSELIVVENANHVFGGKEPWESAELPDDMSFIIRKSIEFINENLKLNR